MKKGILLVNVLLVLCIVALTYKLQADWRSWDRTHNDSSILAAVDLTPPEITAPVMSRPAATANDNDVRYVGDHNLFSADRSSQVPDDGKATVVEKVVPKLANRPSILGMIEMDGIRSVQVLSRQPKDQSEGSYLLKVGDKWEADWTVTDIRDDRIVLEAGEGREEVLIHDPNKRRAPAATKASTHRPGEGPAGDTVLTVGGAGKTTTARPAGVAANRTAAKAPLPNRTTNAMRRNQNNRDSRSGLSSGRQLFRSRVNRSTTSGSSTTPRRTNPFNRTTSSGRR